MSLKVQGRIPSNAEGKFTEREAAHIAERFRKIERFLAGAAPQFLTPATPTFGGGIVGAPGSGAGSGSGGTGTGGGTTTIVETMEESWTRKFLLMGA